LGYFKLKEDYNYIHGIGDFINLPSNCSFLSGEWIEITLQQPIYLIVDCLKNEQPQHFLDTVAPIVSSVFLEALKKSGISNYQSFPVILKNFDLDLEWPNYFIINVLGLIDSADMTKSSFEEIIPGDINDGVAEFGEYDNLIIDENKTKGMLMFRDLRSPAEIIFNNIIIDSLRKSSPEGGWRMKIEYLGEET